ncbi:YheC/YheD family protein [Brevibacterium sp. JNUCC-42]|nr:YheC/YheD family protein [Brevibacterium sp. JNUCC-42]
MRNQAKTLGIMAIFKGSPNRPTFREKSYYTTLTRIGSKLGIRVVVFSPRQVDFTSRMVIGFELIERVWKRRKIPFPQLIYDRYFMGPHIAKYKPIIERLQNDPQITFLGHGLSGKWQVYNILIKSDILQKWLPHTQLFSPTLLEKNLAEQGAVIIKPMAGTHGSGVIRVSSVNKGYELMGRTQDNKPFTRMIPTKEGLLTRIQKLTAGRKYILQPYLSLHTTDGLPFDIRILVQKNGKGNWTTTGKAVRVGKKESITSNLHGGGIAVRLEDFLSQHYPHNLCKEIEKEVNMLAQLLPPFLEENHGRLVELGIDVGVDTQGHVWIIEVNSRPGRTVFRQIEDGNARLRSVALPVKYAKYLLKERIGG